MHAALDFASASRADTSPVHLEVLAKLEDAPQFQESKREGAGVRHDRSQLLRGYAAHFSERAHARPEQHFVLDDVSDAGEDGLIEQYVRNLGVWECSHLRQRRAAVPFIRHDIGGKVIRIPRMRILHVLHGGCPDRNLTVWKVHHQTRRAAAPVIASHRCAFDRRGERAPEHEMHAQRERVELKDEMFPPREDVLDFEPVEAFDADLAVSGHASYSPAHEGLQLLGGKMKRRTFHRYFA
jgi:hypothetical protein